MQTRKGISLFLAVLVLTFTVVLTVKINVSFHVEVTLVAMVIASLFPISYVSLSCR